jgi:hypothetical protein
MEDEVFAAMAELDAIAPPIDLTQAVTHLRAHGFGAEADALTFSAIAAWTMLKQLRSALRRMDPAWCELNGEKQLDDEGFDEALAALEDLLEVQP